MGSPIAGHIKRGGYEVTVFNRSLGKATSWRELYGGEIASSPAELAEGCDMVFLCVGNDEDVEQVILGKKGVLESLNPGGIIVDHTTTSARSEEHTSELQSRRNLVCRLLLEQKNHFTHPHLAQP